MARVYPCAHGGPTSTAFTGPLDIRERLGGIDAETLAAADLEATFREKPAIHRYPGNMAKRVHELAVHIRDTYDGDASRVWTGAADSEELGANIAALDAYQAAKREHKAEWSKARAPA